MQVQLAAYTRSGLPPHQLPDLLDLVPRVPSEGGRTSVIDIWDRPTLAQTFLESLASNSSLPQEKVEVVVEEEEQVVLVAVVVEVVAEKVVDDGPLGIVVNTRTRRHRLICIEQRFDVRVRAEAVRPFSRKQS